jgi:hypothetical protein
MSTRSPPSFRLCIDTSGLHSIMSGQTEITMEFYQLNTFVKVADEGNLTRAAKRLQKEKAGPPDWLQRPG